MTSVPYKQAKRWAASLEDKWFDHWADYGESIGPDFTDFFHAVHDDGTTYSFPDCYVVQHHLDKWDATYIVVFTEHQGTHVLAENELIWYARYEQRATIPELDNDHQPVGA